MLSTCGDDVGRAVSTAAHISARKMLSLVTSDVGGVDGATRVVRLWGEPQSATTLAAHAVRRGGGAYLLEQAPARHVPFVTF